MICVNSYIPTSGESAFESPVFQRYLGHPKRPGHPPMSWISTFRGWEGTPKAKIVFCREFFQKCGGKWWSISLYLRSCRSRKHRTPKIRKVFVHGYPKKWMQVQFPEMASIFSQKNGLWRVDSFYCNTSHTPKNLNFFHVADIFGTFMNHFMSRRDTVGDTSFETQVNIEAFGIWCFLIHSGSRMLSGAEGHANWGTAWNKISMNHLCQQQKP